MERFYVSVIQYGSHQPVELPGTWRVASVPKELIWKFYLILMKFTLKTDTIQLLEGFSVYLEQLSLVNLPLLTVNLWTPKKDQENLNTNLALK